MVEYGTRKQIVQDLIEEDRRDSKSQSAVTALSHLHRVRWALAHGSPSTDVRFSAVLTSPDRLERNPREAIDQLLERGVFEQKRKGIISIS